MSAAAGKWRLWLPTVLMVVCVGAFSWLAAWQYDRAQQREARIAAVRAARDAPPAAATADNLKTLSRYAHVRVTGRYLGERQTLLMEMTRPGGARAGFEVLTPLKLPSGQLLLINRGWVPEEIGGGAHADLGVSGKSRQVVGFIGPLPRPGLHLGGNPAEIKDWPAHLLFPTWKELAQIYGPQLLHRMILLSPQAQEGFSRDWQMKPRHGPARNYSYMVQWSIFAAIVLGLWFWFSVRRFRRRRKT